MRCSSASCGLGTISVLGLGHETWERLATISIDLEILRVSVRLGKPFCAWAHEYLGNRLAIGDRYDEMIKIVLLERDRSLEAIAARPCDKQAARFGNWKCPALMPETQSEWCASCYAREALGK